MLKNIIPPVNQSEIHILVTYVNATGMAINSLYLKQADNPSVSSCDDLLNALTAGLVATRKLRVRLAQEGEPK